MTDATCDRYAWWSAAFTRAYFSQPGRPCVMSVDDADLARLAPEVDAPATDLARSVLLTAGTPTPGDHFPGVSRAFDRWEASGRDGLPPVLPLLGLSVLAASHMQQDGNYASTNYYIRLAELLSEAGGGPVEPIRDSLRATFGSVAEMWRSLDQHLHLHPELGSSTIRDHPHLTRIGFPLSQALVRRSDRARLTRFFSKLEIESRGVPGHVALLSYLRIWVSRPRGFGEPFVRALGDDVLCKMLMPVIIGLAHSWDGTVATPDGHQELTARVTLDFDEWRSSWVVEGKVTRSEVVAGTVAGHSVDVHLEPQPGRTYADLAGVPAAHGALCRSGFELRGQHSVVRARAARVICFTEDPGVGGWLSRDAMSPYEEQVIAASAELGHGLRVVLQAAADPGWREVRQDPASPLLAGYSIYRKVRFADPERLDAALEGFPALGVAGLRPEPTARARFINGLRAARELSRDHYLAGCAPDLLLPVGAESRAVTVTLDGFSQQFRASGFPLELRRLTDLETGPHAVAVEGETLTFHLVDDDPGPDPAEGTATLHWTDSGVLTSRADASLACGADVVGVDLVRPVLARRGADETLVIFSDGRCEATAETGPPAFLREEALQPSPYFEIDLPHSAAWLAQRRGERWTVTALSCDPPTFAPGTLGTDGRQAWSRLVANGPEDDDRWMSYLAAAGVES